MPANPLLRAIKACPVSRPLVLSIAQDTDVVGGLQLVPGSEPEPDMPFITVTPEGDTSLFGTEVLAENEDLADNRRHWQVPLTPHTDVNSPRYASQ